MIVKVSHVAAITARMCKRERNRLRKYRIRETNIFVSNDYNNSVYEIETHLRLFTARDFHQWYKHMKKHYWQLAHWRLHLLSTQLFRINAVSFRLVVPER